MEPVRYIDKTRDYYAAEGYSKPYAWAQFDDVPFTPLAKPLAECRIALVSTGDVVQRSQAQGGRLAFTADAYAIASDIPAGELVSRQESYDRYATTLDDVDAYFPVTHLRALAKAGRIAGVTSRFYGVPTSYSHRKTLKVDAPKVLAWARQDGADAVLLTPV
jgi:D-proline reductase (dithiol) PrdB